MRARNGAQERASTASPAVARVDRGDAARRNAGRKRLPVILSAALPRFGKAMILPIFVLYAATFTDSIVAISAAFAITGIVQASAQFPAGMVSDRMGEQPLLLFSLFMFAAGSFLTGTAWDFFSLFVGRFVMGLGVMSVAAIAMAAEPRGIVDRTRRLSEISLATALAFIAGSVVGPYLYYFFGGGRSGGRAVFFTVGLIALVVFSVQLRGFLSRFLSGSTGPTHTLSQPLRGKSGMSHVETGGSVKKRGGVKRSVKKHAPKKRMAGGVFLSLFGSAVARAETTMLLLLFPLMLVPFAPDGDYWRYILPVFVLGLGLLAVAHRVVGAVGVRKTSVAVFLLSVGGAVVMFLSAATGTFGLSLGAATGGAAQMGGEKRILGLSLAVVSLSLVFSSVSLYDPLVPTVLFHQAEPSARGFFAGAYNTARYLGDAAGGFCLGISLLIGPSFGVPAVLLGLSAVLFLSLFFASKDIPEPERSAGAERRVPDGPGLENAPGWR